MQELILFPLSPVEFLGQIKLLMEEVVDAKMGKANMPPELAEKTLLLPAEVCQVLRISKTTLYEIIKDKRLEGFKIGRKRYFSRTDVEKIIRRQF